MIHYNTYHDTRRQRGARPSSTQRAQPGTGIAVWAGGRLEERNQERLAGPYSSQTPRPEIGDTDRWLDNRACYQRQLRSLKPMSAVASKTCSTDTANWTPLILGYHLRSILAAMLPRPKTPSMILSSKYRQQPSMSRSTGSARSPSLGGIHRSRWVDICLPPSNSVLIS
jgi:hypothetical protein